MGRALGRFALVCAIWAAIVLPIAGSAFSSESALRFAVLTPIVVAFGGSLLVVNPYSKGSKALAEWLGASFALLAAVLVIAAIELSIYCHGGGCFVSH